MSIDISIDMWKATVNRPDKKIARPSNCVKNIISIISNYLDPSPLDVHAAMAFIDLEARASRNTAHFFGSYSKSEHGHCGKRNLFLPSSAHQILLLYANPATCSFYGCEWCYSYSYHLRGFLWSTNLRFRQDIAPREKPAGRDMHSLIGDHSGYPLVSGQLT